MRSLFVLPLVAILLLIPGSNGCIHSGAGKSNVTKVECRENKSVVLEKIPGNIVVSSRCGDYSFKKESITKAVEIFVLEFSESFEIDEAILWVYLHGLKIDVSVIPKVVNAAYSVDGKLLENGNVSVSGLAFGPKHIWVEIKTSQIWSSSLIHELVHVVIWNQNVGVHGDPDHEGKQYSGWTKNHTKLIKKINNILLDIEI